MKLIRKWSLLLSVCAAASAWSIGGVSAAASAADLSGAGGATVEDSGKSDPVDPDHPEDVVDPGVGPSTKGSLRFDFVSAIDFGSVKITGTDRQYHALAQQFADETGARGTYVQISDLRGGKSGWTLQVKQTKQFTNPVIQEAGEQELVGAVLSLDKGWANSSGSSATPTVTRDTIAINSMDTAYTVATAADGQGKGVWTIEFGASEENDQGQKNTLTPLTDEAGNKVIDSTYNKQAYSNSAISLTVPDSTKIYPVQYQTELTWILAELP